MSIGAVGLIALLIVPASGLVVFERDQDAVTALEFVAPGQTPVRVIPETDRASILGALERLVEGNRIEGHRDGVVLFGVAGRPTRRNVIRDNTIVGTVFPLGPWADQEDAEAIQIEDNLIEGNRVMGGAGVGIALKGASGNRIVDNAINGITLRDPSLGEANGSGIWLSPGSDANGIAGNTFEGIATYPIVLEGDSNRVELRSASDEVRDLGQGNRIDTEGIGAVQRGDSGAARLQDAPLAVRVAPPTGERETDRASLVAALEEVEPGGTIAFAPGTYLVGGFNLDVAVPGITLLGHPDGTTIRGCDPEVFEDHEVAMFACNALGLSGGNQTVRGLTFEYAWHGLTVGCCLPEDVEQVRSGAWSPEPTRPGGDIIEDNTFRYTPNGLRVMGRSAEPTVIRGNRFIDVYHAIGINGGGIRFVDNRIYTEQPHRVPTSTHPGDAINISPAGGPGDHTTCSDNVVAGNRIEGHTHGVRLAVYAPDTSCRQNVIADNTIAVERVPFVRRWFGIPVRDEADSTVVGVPLGLVNYPMVDPETWGRPEPGRMSVIEDNLIEGNEIIGGYGLGIEVVHASRNRIVDNAIRGIRARNPFPGNVLLDEYVAWRRANGSGIWLSPGSDENEIVGNAFEDLEGPAVFLEGDRNRLELRSPSGSVRDLGAGNRVTEPGTGAEATNPIGRSSQPRWNAPGPVRSRAGWEVTR